MLSKNFLTIMENQNYCISGVLYELLQRPTWGNFFNSEGRTIRFTDFTPTGNHSSILDEFVERYINSPTIAGPIEFVDFLINASTDNILKEIIETNVQAPIGVTPLEAFKGGFDCFRNNIFDENVIPYVKNLTLEVITSEKLGPILGRDKEVKELEVVFNKTIKNNAVLTGDGGVGKTSIVEQFALLHKDDYSIYELNTLGLTSNKRDVAQAIFEGIVSTLKNMSGNVVLFIDEFHLLTKPEVGLGDSIKTLLLSRENTISFVVATTTEEFKKFVKPDKALERRFSPIPVVELSGEVLVTALDTFVETLVEKRNISCDKEIISFVISKMKVERQKTSPDKEKDIFDAAFAKAYINGESYISKQDVAEIMSIRLNIPTERLLGSMKEKILTLKDTLKEKIVGQNFVIDDISKILIGRSVIKDRNKPMATFFFAGPTSTGKTQLAKEMAKHLMGSEKNLLIYSGTDFMEEHTISALLGSPDGYVNSDDGGRLYNDLSAKPFSVLLFDEFEKAHPDVQKMLLPILDEGVVKNRRGLIADATNCIVIFTSNLAGKVTDNASGVEPTPLKTRRIGFVDDFASETEGDVMESFDDYSDAKDKVKSELLAQRKDRLSKETEVKRFLLPELVSRIDSILVFDALSEEAIKSIITSQIEEQLNEYRENYNLTISYPNYTKLSNEERKYISTADLDKDIVEFICKKANKNPRKSHQAIDRFINSLIAESLLREDFKDGDTIELVVLKGRVAIIVHSNDEEVAAE